MAVLDALAEISSEAELRELLGTPARRVITKERSRLHERDIEWLAASPFCLVATSGADGTCDVSPKGDPPGFALVLNETTIAIPERPGNKRADGYRNILANPHVGVLFMVPGIDEVIRVNGRARLRTDPDLLDAMAIKGKSATLAVVIDSDEVYVHCARAILRSDLWDPERFADPDVVPTVRDILVEQHAMPVPADEPRRQEPYRAHLY